MQYDNIKQSLGNVFNRNPFLRKCFYGMLDLLLLRAWHIKKELRRIKKNLPADALVLDAGAGFGQYAYYMSKLGRRWRIKAVDVKAGQVEDCNQFFAQIGRNDRVRFEVADLTEFREPDKYCLAISVDVMEHIPDDAAVFRNICASLGPDGVLLISTPSDRGGSDADEHHGSFVDEHVRDGYSVDEIRDKLTAAGFSDIDVQYTYGRPGHISWLLSMKYPMLMLRASKLFFILLPFYYLVTFPFCFLLNWRDTCARHKSGTGLKVKAVKSHR
ncbi:MAG: class I SAM-dependent methyltransferase [Bacteroidales bacterium]|jgi:SAM-dependent methyltransferase|nr:class I SAM-dependent methyltransferase [Bacteroidales bacterium]